MANFVLIHGGWGGGWLWRPVAERLWRRGHCAFTPTLTGMGERVHLLHRGLDYETWYTDVVNVIRFENLEQVVLVGFSFGGIIVSGVAELIPERLSSLVYVDSLVPQDGQDMLDVGGAASEYVLEQVDNEGDGWLWIPTGETEVRFVPQPCTEKMRNTRFRVRNPERLKLPCSYILCSEHEGGFGYVPKPDELTDMLLEIAARR